MHLKKILGLSGLRIIYGVFGLIYSILQVRIFGTSREVEIFFVANGVVYLVTSLTQSGQLSEFFLPEYLSIKVKFGKEAAHRAFSVLINRFAVFLSIILFLFYFISPWVVSLMAPGFSVSDKELCVKMFRIFLIFLEFQFINSFIDVTLNAEKVFGRVEWAAILNSIISLILLICFYKTFGIWILVITLFAGKIIEFIITMIFVRKIGIKYSLIWSEKTFDAKRFFRLMFSTSGYVLATQAYTVIFTAMATLLPQGTYAIFKYVQGVSAKVSGILLSPLSTVFFSHFSDHVSAGKKDLEKKMREPILYSFMLGVTFTSLVILFGREAVNILWKSKAVSSYFLALGYWMLIINFIAFTFSAVGSIYRKATVSLNNGKKLYHFWIVTQIISALLSWLIITPLGWIGLSVVAFLNTALMATVSVWVAKESGIVFSKTIDFKNFIPIAISTMIFVILSLALNYSLQSMSSLLLIIVIKMIFAVSLGFVLLYFRHKLFYERLSLVIKPVAFKLKENFF